MSGASERANGLASGPVLQSVFLAVIDHSAREGRRSEVKKERIEKSTRSSVASHARRGPVEGRMGEDS